MIKKLIFFLLLFIFFSAILFPKLFTKNKNNIPEKCEQVKVFSYSGDIRICANFMGQLSEEDSVRCNQRFEKLKGEEGEYQKYKAMTCVLEGYSSEDIPEPALGCTEYCVYTCCD